MAMVCLLLFLVFSVLHLAYSWQDHRKGRAVTKPFLIALLGLYYAFSAGDPAPVLLAALFTSWLGDVLLIPKGNKWFIIGGSSFLLSHFLFMAAYVPHIRFGEAPWLWLLPVAAGYVFLSVKVIRAVKDNTPKLMVVPMWLYLLVNSAMNLLALAQLCTARTAGAAVAYAGALLFFLSDCILFLVRYHRNRDLVPRRHFPVMLCYLAGEFLITWGMMLLA